MYSAHVDFDVSVCNISVCRYIDSIAIILEDCLFLHACCYRIVCECVKWMLRVLCLLSEL